MQLFCRSKITFTLLVENVQQILHQRRLFAKYLKEPTDKDGLLRILLVVCRGGCGLRSVLAESLIVREMNEEGWNIFIVVFGPEQTK